MRPSAKTLAVTAAAGLGARVAVSYGIGVVGNMLAAFQAAADARPAPGATPMRKAELPPRLQLDREIKGSLGQVVDLREETTTLTLH
jgi:hypothetical protein